MLGITKAVKSAVGRGKSMAEANAQSKGYSKRPFDDNRGQASGNVISLIVALTVGGLVAAFLIPIAIDELAAVDAGEDWSSGADALWGILDVMIVLAVFLFFTGVALASTDAV